MAVSTRNTILEFSSSLRWTVTLNAKWSDLCEILENHIFVGIVDLNRTLSLLQHSTKLYLVNHGALAYVLRFFGLTTVVNTYSYHHREELFYQLGLRQFGDYSRLKLEPPPPLKTLIKLAVDAEEGTKNSRLSKAQIVDVRLVLSFFLQNNTPIFV